MTQLQEDIQAVREMVQPIPEANEAFTRIVELLEDIAALASGETVLAQEGLTW